MMDLPCVQWQDHVGQKWTGLDPELKDKFTSLREIDYVFKLALTLINQDDLDFMQSVSAGHCVHKDSEQAAKCRERGNAAFKSRDYRAATLYYSQGVCSAPQSSEQLSLCFANRSAGLFYLQRFQESLADIDEALKNGYPSHLSHKLEERRSQCHRRISAAQRAKESHHSPASKRSEDADGAQEASVGPLSFGICPQAAVGFSVEKGRHLVAAERIAAGEVILRDRPYSCVLIPGTQEETGKGAGPETERGVFGAEHRRCHSCLTETLSPVPCEGCTYSRYCSVSCRRDAWEEYHRWECPLGADLLMMGVMSQLALRVTLKAGLRNIQRGREPISDEQTKSEPSCSNTAFSDSRPPNSSHCGDSYSSVFHLLHHLNHHSPALRFLWAVTIATLYLKLSKAGPPPASWDLGNPSGGDSQSAAEEGRIRGWSAEQWLLGSAVLRHVLQLRCNAQAILMKQDTGAADASVQSNREVRIATAIFPTLSLLNHSCSPNTSLVFSTGPAAHLPPGSDLSADFSRSVAEYRPAARGVTVTVRAAKVMSPGQEILHCYGPHSSRMATQERQRLLQEQYYFLCQCEACALQQGEEEQAGSPVQSGLLCGKCKGPLRTEDGGSGFRCSQSSCALRMSSSEVSQRLQEIRVDLEKSVELMERETPEKALRLLKKTWSRSGLILAETHPLQGELEDATARAYATMGDWSNAASHLERSAAAIGSQYGEDSVELGQQLFKLAQLHFNGGARGPALSVIPKVRRLLCLHCGPRCPELQELQAMEDCLRGHV